MSEPSSPFRTLSDYLATRRETILANWRSAADSDPAQTTISSLTRSQFDDHIPQVLDAFQKKLKSLAGGNEASEAEARMKLEEVKHGLHRWQQGYRLEELMHEWGHLHLCLFNELQTYASIHPEVGPGVLNHANRELLVLVHAAINESTGQYARLQQEEAAGHLRDLQRAQEQDQELERHRARLMHQVVHDLGGNAQSVSSAAALLSYSDLSEEEREDYLILIRRSTGALSAMLGDLMALARLEAGQEGRNIASFDAAALLTEFCSVTLPVARERQLFLKMDGAPAFWVVGDATKIRRIVQNLVLNALKYTDQGGVIVSWRWEDGEKWSVTVRDTGPGLLAGPGSPIMNGLKEATASAHEAEGKPARDSGQSASVPASNTDQNLGLPTPQHHGEGIGLSIVKRLCELLDASLELVSSPESGTTFKVILPRHYKG